MEVPNGFMYLWNWFWDLASRRPDSATGGVQPITYQELESWSRLTGVSVRGEEVTILLKMDAAYSTVNGEEREAINARLRNKTAPTPKKRSKK